jgi:hypothetical protein
MGLDKSLLRVRTPRYCKQAVVSLPFIFASLLDLQDTDYATGKHKARHRRGIMNDHDVERIAVVGRGGGNKSPIVGISQADQQRLGEGEGLHLRFVAELRTAAARRLNHNTHVSILRKGRQIN